MVLLASMARGEVLAGDLCLLERDTFDMNKYIPLRCPAMSEKSVKKLRSQLKDLKDAFVSFSRGDVHFEYKNFVKATRDISQLETSLFKVRNLLSVQVAIIHGLLEQPFVDELASDDEDTAAASASQEEDGEMGQEYVPSDWEKRALALLDKLEILLAERKTDDAVLHIKEGEKLFSKHGPNEPHAEALRGVLYYMREKLVEELIEATGKSSVRCSEVRAAASILKRLGESSKAHTLILTSHDNRLLQKLKGLRRSSSYGGGYTAALSQLVFSAIAQALKDSVAVFGSFSTYASEFMVWAHQVAEKFVMLLKKRVLSSAAAAGGLRAAGECVMIAFGHCAELEKEGLALCPLLSGLLKPSIEQAVSANLKRIGESTLALAAADNWSVSDPYHDSLGGRRPSRRADGVQLRLTSSALKFNAMIEDFLSCIAPLIKFQLESSVYQALSEVYQQYVTFLVRALPISEPSEASWQTMEERSLKRAETLSQQLALVGNAAALANEVLPGVVQRLQLYERTGTEQTGTDKLEPVETWRKELDEAFENVRMIVCKFLLRDVIFDRQGKLLIKTQMYSTAADDESWVQQPLPSQAFQALFSKVSSIAKTGEEVLRGQEDVCKLLITELLQSVSSCLSNNRDFWLEMEEGSKAFSTMGLQKFVLDIQFVVHFASEGQYATEAVYKALAELIASATNAFALKGGDPMSALPEDRWFLKASQAAFVKLASNK